MGEEAQLRLSLNTNEPIALPDFVGAFTGLEHQFEKFLARKHPDHREAAEFFVKEISKGSIIANLIVGATILSGVASPGLPGIIDAIDKTQVLTTFVRDLKEHISPYFKRGGRNEQAGKEDLADFLKTVSTIARDPQASASLEAAAYQDGTREVKVAFKFSAKQARIAQTEIDDHRRELEAKSDTEYTRVLLRFVRPSVEKGKPGRKGGERGVIDKIHRAAFPILYASDLAEERIRHEKLIADHIFNTIFDVDVNVEVNANGKPVAYRITAVHAVLEGPEEKAA